MFLISSRCSSIRRFLVPLSAASILAFFVLLLFYRLLFTDRVLASGDILHYFYPYRDYAAASLRAGRIPFWNPYIFMGAPFLANPQAAALYPLHWPLSWLPVTRQLYWSGAIHAWILALGGFALMRRWGMGWLAAVGTGLVLAGSGFYGGLLGHINQMNGAAWLPWLLWALEGRWLWEKRAERSEERAESAGNSVFASFYFKYAICLLPFALFVALTLLAGHTQTTYINLFGVGAWLLATSLRSYSCGIGHLAASFVIYVLGVVLGALLAAAQLLPTLELSQLGLRSGGLSYVDVTSFSLRPLLLHWTLLPSYGLRDLSVVFATLGYTEFVAYVGVVGLLLALVAVVSSLRETEWRRPWAVGHWPLAALCGIFFAGLGLFLALGRWNPFSFLFYHVIPGYDLFRTPARWMMLYTLGLAVLAGVGAEWLWHRLRNAGGSKAVSLRLSEAAGAALLAILALDLLLAARALPHTEPTAPQAVYDVRTASAHLLTEPQRALHPAAAGRLLSISDITFDPGDMSDWRRILRGGARPQVSEAAFTEFIIALKSQEILAPNLSLQWRIPTVDGFDGGVLPLQRYNAFLSLLIPPDELVPDGRVREQLQTIPSGHILDLMDARFVVTDKLRDLWFDGVYYDRQIGATLNGDGASSSVGEESGGGARLTVDVPHSFEATAVDVIGYVTLNPAEPHAGAAGAANQPVAEITALVGGERLAIGRLLAGSGGGAFETAGLQPAFAGSGEASVVFRDGKTGQEEYLARFTLPEAARPEQLEISLVEGPASTGLAVQAVTLIDERTNTFVPLLPSDRGSFQRVHSGDVKIYERRGGNGRAQLVESVRRVSSLDEAVTELRDMAVDGAAQAAVVEASAEAVAEWGLVDMDGSPAAEGAVSIISYAPERIVIRVSSERPGFLVLKDAYFPGWRATVNGEAVDVVPTNVLFRGVPVPAGESEVVFSYMPTAWLTGLGLSLAGGLMWLVLASLTFIGAWRRKR